MNMSDIKRITVVVDNGGQLAATFKDGELKIWPDGHIYDSPEDATLYNLNYGCTEWTIEDAPTSKDTVTE